MFVTNAEGATTSTRKGRDDPAFIHPGREIQLPNGVRHEDRRGALSLAGALPLQAPPLRAIRPPRPTSSDSNEGGGVNPGGPPGCRPLDKPVGDPSPASPTEVVPERGWSIVPPRRRKTLVTTDRAALILWGVPPSVPARNVWALLKDRGVAAASLEWRGVDTSRHLVLRFESELSRNGQEHQVAAAMSPLGVRSLGSRTWDTREEQRKQGHVTQASGDATNQLWEGGGMGTHASARAH